MCGGLSGRYPKFLGGAGYRKNGGGWQCMYGVNLPLVARVLEGGYWMSKKCRWKLDVETCLPLQ